MYGLIERVKKLILTIVILTISSCVMDVQKLSSVIASDYAVSLMWEKNLAFIQLFRDRHWEFIICSEQLNNVGEPSVIIS
jgi:hypothetical protein